MPRRGLHFPRIRKELVVGRVREQAGQSALVAVASTANLSSTNQFKVRYSLQDAGASIVPPLKNTLKGMGLRQLGGEFESLLPLLRGKTMLVCGPTDGAACVPLAKQLLALEKTYPDFYVLGALHHSTRILQLAEIERLSKLPPADEVHAKLVSALMPGSSLQVPSVAAMLVGLLQTHVESLCGGAAGGGAAGE